jgi:hypothetical protein
VGQGFRKAAAGFSTILEHLRLLLALLVRFSPGLLLFELASAVGNGPTGRRDPFPEAPVRIEGGLLLLSRHRPIIACGSTARLT